MSKETSQARLNQLTSFGLHRYDSDQLMQMKSSLQTQIAIGLNRTDLTQRGIDGGLAAIQTNVSPVTPEQWSKVKEGTTVITGAFAGTNWVSGSVQKIDGSPVYKELKKKKIPIKDRKVTYTQFIKRMADQIEGSQGKLNGQNVETIAISLGFAHENSITENGDIDARLLSAEPAKFWKIKDFNRHKNDYIGASLLDELHRRGLKNINHFVIQNDTNAVAHTTEASNTSKLPVGFVFGTGINAALNGVNLELGPAVVDKEDEIFKEMKRRHLVPHGNLQNTIEYRMGGDFIKFRAVAALGLLHKNNLITEYVIQSLLQSNDGAIISEIASGAIDRKSLNKALHTFGLINEEMYTELKEIAKLTLQQAGQMIGVVIAAVTEAAGYKGGEASYNVEGSVYWHGCDIIDTVNTTLREIDPHNDLLQGVEAMGVVGIAQLGMVHDAERGNL